MVHMFAMREHDDLRPRHDPVHAYFAVLFDCALNGERLDYFPLVFRFYHF